MVLLIDLNPFFMLLAMVGVPLQVFGGFYYSLQLAIFNHNALTPKLGWLEKVLITPSHHRVHHLNEKQYADTNYGGTFCCGINFSVRIVPGRNTT